MRIFRTFLATGTLLSLMWLGFHYGQQIPFKEQAPLYDALRTTAAIIFAVVGAWLAIVYPDRLKLSLGVSAPKNARSPNNMAVLLSPIVNSTVVLCVVLIIGILAPLIKQFSWATEHAATFRGISYALLVGLTIWQAWTIILTLVPADLILSKSTQEAHAQKAIKGLTRTSQMIRKNGDKS